MTTGASAEVTSIRSPRVAAARRLAKRAFRAAGRRFLAEGPQPVREALASPGTVLEMFLTRDGDARHPELGSTARDATVPVSRVSGEVMAALAQTVTPQGVLAVCRFVDRPLGDVLAGGPRLLAVLAGVRDPGNAGTVIRAADAAGADGVVLTESSVDVYNAKCVRASAGSLFHLAVVTGEPISRLAAGVRAAGLQVLAADGAGERSLDDLAATDQLDRPTAWVFGNEAWGLTPETLDLADAVVRVPIHGRAESLNLAAAAVLCLYASAGAQRQPR